MRDPENKRRWGREWYKKNPEYFKKKRKKNKEKHNEYMKKYRANPENGEKMRERQRRYYREQRAIVLEHYGAICKCCEETQKEFLSFDHVENGRHNPAIRPSHLGRWIIRNKFPKSIQILCYNCNMSKGFIGKCPHQDL